LIIPKQTTDLLLLFDKQKLKTKIACKLQLFIVIYNMPIMVTRSMKKRMEQVLQKSAKVRHAITWNDWSSQRST
jgi:hypothetical protein